MKTVIFKIKVPDEHPNIEVMGVEVWYKSQSEPKGYFTMDKNNIEILTPPTDEEIEEMAAEQSIHLGIEGYAAANNIAREMRSQIWGDEG